MRYIIIGMLLAQTLFSVQLAPITQRVDSQKGRNITFTVKNTDKGMAAAECSVLKVVGHDENGKEIREETDDVVIYPSQFVLQEKETKGVRVNYTKTTMPKKEEVYRVLATQLSLKLQEESAGTEVKGAMRFVFSYEGLLFVGPSEEKATISSSIKGADKDSFSIKMTNDGIASHFVHVKHFDFNIETDSGVVKLGEKDFGTFGGIRLLPDETFVLNIKRTKELEGKELKTISIVAKEK